MRKSLWDKNRFHFWCFQALLFQKCLYFYWRETILPLWRMILLSSSRSIRNVCIEFGSISLKGVQVRQCEPGLCSARRVVSLLYQWKWFLFCLVEKSHLKWQGMRVLSFQIYLMFQHSCKKTDPGYFDVLQLFFYWKMFFLFPAWG